MAINRPYGIKSSFVSYSTSNFANTAVFEGAVTVSNTLSVSGLSTFNTTNTVGNAAFGSNVTIAGNLSVTGGIAFGGTQGITLGTQTTGPYIANIVSLTSALSVVGTGDATAIANLSIRNANTTVNGITQLVDSFTNTSIILAPTANALRNVYDLAGLAYNTAINAYSNAATMTINLSGNAYSNAISFSANATNITNGILPAARLSGTYTININGNASTAGGYQLAVPATPSTIVVRDGSGNISQTRFNRVRTDGIDRGSYGSISITGTAASPFNSYCGIDFTAANSTFMVGIPGISNYTGIYKNNDTWQWAFNGNTLEFGFVPWGRLTGTPFNYANPGGQPSYVWGTNDGNTYNVYNPAVFNVSYLGGYSSSQYLRKDEIGFSNNVVGYWIQPSGFKIMWGRFQPTPNSYQNVNFPTAFASYAQVTLSSVAELGNNNAQANPPGVYGIATTYFSVFTSADSVTEAFWIAVGY